jgi:Flp pilus assembly protein TadD
VLVAAVAAVALVPVVAGRIRTHRLAGLARRAVAEGRWGDADVALERWLRADPVAAEAHFLRARAAFAGDRPREIVEELSRAEALGHPKPAIERLRAIILARSGRFAEVEPTLRTIYFNSQAPDPGVDEALARGYLESFRLNAAEQVIDRWMTDEPTAGRPFYYRTEIDKRLSMDPTVSVKYFRAALARDPHLYPARLGLAEALSRGHRLAEAAREYAAYLAVRPDDPAGLFGAAVAALLVGDEDTAIRHLDRALLRKPDDPTVLGERAAIDIRRGDAAAALPRLDQAVRIDPYDPGLRRLRAQALDQLGRRDDARSERLAARRLKDENERLTEIQQRLVRAPQDQAPRIEVAQWMLDHGRDDEGFRWAKLILQDHPGHREASRILAEYYARKGNAGLANFYRDSVK